MLVSGFALVASAGGCSSSSSDGSSGSSSGSSGSSEAGAGDAGADAAAAVVNDCKNFVDRSAAGASRTITWDFGISTAPERCLIVKKGQDVTFSGDFTTHPLTAAGGDKPNPIANADATGKVSFPAVGTFGFLCGIHPSMTGAIQVVP